MCVLQVGVTIQLSSSGLTKIATFTPFYMFLNTALVSCVRQGRYGCQSASACVCRMLTLDSPRTDIRTDIRLWLGVACVPLYVTCCL